MCYDYFKENYIKGVIKVEKKKPAKSSISVRVPSELYSQYKQTLMDDGRIISYDIINHMKRVVEKGKGRKNI